MANSLGLTVPDGFELQEFAVTDDWKRCAVSRIGADGRPWFKLFAVTIAAQDQLNAGAWRALVQLHLNRAVERLKRDLALRFGSAVHA